MQYKLITFSLLLSFIGYSFAGQEGVFTQLMCACYENLPYVEQLLQQAKAKENINEIINAVDSNGQTELMYACYFSPNNVPLLLNCNSEVNVVNDNGNTALLFACAKNNMSIIPHLLRVGAEVNVINDNGSTPLSVARAINNQDLTSLLLQYRAIN